MVSFAENKTGRMINEYHCRDCGVKCVTENVVPGATPLILICHECVGDAVSVDYKCDQSQEPDLVWFSPDTINQLFSQVKWELDYTKASGLMPFDKAFLLQFEHVCKGGLILAPSRDVIYAWQYGPDVRPENQDFYLALVGDARVNEYFNKK